MSDSLKTRTRRSIEVAVAFTPWIVSMYLLYWLEYGAIWTTETAHRGKISVAILICGMGLSFLIQSRITKRNPKQ